MEKELIIEYLHLIEEFKVSDPKMIEYKKNMDLLSRKTLTLYTSIQNGNNMVNVGNGGSGVSNVNDQLEKTTMEYNDLKKEKEDYLNSKFKTFMEDCPKSIKNMILEDAVNFELLEHVLTQVKNYNEGNITYNNGMNNGLEFIRRVNNLPDDFFNKQ